MKRRLGYPGEGHGLEKPPLQVSPADWQQTGLKFWFFPHRHWIGKTGHRVTQVPSKDLLTGP